MKRQLFDCLFFCFLPHNLLFLVICVLTKHKMKINQLVGQVSGLCNSIMNISIGKLDGFNDKKYDEIREDIFEIFFNSYTQLFENMASITSFFLLVGINRRNKKIVLIPLIEPAVFHELGQPPEDILGVVDQISSGVGDDVEVKSLFLFTDASVDVSSIDQPDVVLQTDSCIMGTCSNGSSDEINAFNWSRKYKRDDYGEVLWTSEILKEGEQVSNSFSLS